MNAEQAKRILRGPEKHPTLYMPLDLPEFADWKITQPCVERSRMIEGFIGEFFHGVPASEGDFAMLDVGCHTGWFVRHFHRQGWMVRGVEFNREWREVAIWAHGRHFPDENDPATIYWDDDLLGIPKTDIRPFGVVLALSMLMYPFWRGGNASGVAAVRRLRDLGHLVFIDFGGQYARHLPFDESTAETWMTNVGGFSHGQFLGHSDFEQRPLFAFW